MTTVCQLAATTTTRSPVPSSRSSALHARNAARFWFALITQRFAFMELTSHRFKETARIKLTPLTGYDAA